MEYVQLQTFMTVLLGICALIVAISGACAVVVKFWRYAHKDTEENTRTIKEFNDWLSSDKRRIEALERKQEHTEEMNKLQLKALFTLLGHEIDGNHTEQLKEVRGEINVYLINKVGDGNGSA